MVHDVPVASTSQRASIQGIEGDEHGHEHSLLCYVHGEEGLLLLRKRLRMREGM